MINQYLWGYSKFKYFMRVPWGYFAATVTEATAHAVAAEYPKSALKATLTSSSHSDTESRSYNIHLADQAESSLDL